MASAKATNSASIFQRRRRLSRILAVQYVYCADSNQQWSLDLVALQHFKFLVIFGSRDEEDEDGFFDQYENLGVEVDAAWAYAEKLIRGVLENRVTLDEKIADAAKNWTIQRMTLLDRAVLRVGACEVLQKSENSEGVTAATAINEAVELAKLFGESESPKFINGVLDRIRRVAEEQSRAKEE